MRRNLIGLAVASLACACATQHPMNFVGPPLGESTAPGPRDIAAPPAKSGTVSMSVPFSHLPVGPAPGIVAPEVYQADRSAASSTNTDPTPWSSFPQPSQPPPPPAVPQFPTYENPPPPVPVVPVGPVAVVPAEPEPPPPPPPPQ